MIQLTRTQTMILEALLGQNDIDIKTIINDVQRQHMVDPDIIRVSLGKLCKEDLVRYDRIGNTPHYTITADGTREYEKGLEDHA